MRRKRDLRQPLPRTACCPSLALAVFTLELPWFYSQHYFYLPRQLEFVGTRLENGPPFLSIRCSRSMLFQGIANFLKGHESGVVVVMNGREERKG